MTKTQLKQSLVRENVPEDIYSLEGGIPNEMYCLGKRGEAWEVYYSERGEKSSLKVFATEDSACEFFHSWLIRSLKSMGILK